MGNQIYASSNSPILSVQEARANISNEEYDRIRVAFNRFKKSSITFEEFNHHVLGGARVPTPAQRLLFTFFSRGADTLSFDNLLCALVGISRVEHVQASFVEEYPDFRSWGLVPPMLTAPINDAYISFYEVMSYVTHLSVEEVMELEKVFATINDRGQCKITRTAWEAAAGGCFPSSFTSRLFDVFDENRNDLIDFREMVCGVSAMCRGPAPSRLTFLAKIWDLDNDNLLNDEELSTLYEDLKVPKSDRTIGKSKGDKAAMVDFTTWSLGNKYAEDLCQMGLEMGHICLGLRPESPMVELSIVSSFENRVLGLSLPEWNIVSSNWHKDWEKALSLNRSVPPVNNKDIGGIKEDNGPSSMVACLSAESACLRSDISTREYKPIPPSLWRAFLRWHGSMQSVDGQFTRRFLSGDFFDDGKPHLELFPLDVLLMRNDKKKTGKDEMVHAPWAYAQVSRSLTVGELIALCKNELRLGEEEARLWTCKREEKEKESKKEDKEGIRLSDVSKDSKLDRFGGENLLLDDQECTLYELGLAGNKEVKLLLELRDKSTGVWPEEARAAVSGSGTVSTIRGLNEVRPGAVGLVNFGNFCYRNAAVQCLARVSPLTEYFLEAENIGKLQKLNQSQAVRTTLEYALLLKEIWTTNKKNISPIDFNDAIRDTRIFVSGEQHDCQEFVNFLIEQFTSTLSVSLTSNHSATVASIEGKKDEEEPMTDVDKANTSWQQFLEQNNCLVSRLFAGQLKSSLVCKSCRQSSSVFEPFTSLSLPIGFDNVELYQVIVVPRDGSVPTRYGFRLPRDSVVKTFKTVISDAACIPCERLTMLCMSNKGHLMRKASLSDTAPITNFPSGARVYAMELPDPEIQSEWVVTVHRKLQYNYEPYFLGSTAGFDVNIFGVPIIVPCSNSISGKDMHIDVWRQMERFMDAPPISFSNRAADPCEDASSGYPFTLSIVDESLQWCGQCPALKFCRGCPIRPDESITHIPEGTCVAVDWIPTALYLRYNHSQETKFVDDISVRQTWERHYSPSSLEACFAKFSCPETLDALIDCDKCDKKTRRDKVLSIWTLPRYLIIQLKRFEYIREEQRIGKCKRIVDFPLNGFDPTPFVDGERGMEGRARYDCIALANHYGQLESGHFLTYARSEDGKWLLLNDCSVKEVSDEDVDKKNAYLLFYERKDPN